MKILPYICFFISVAGFFVLKSPIGRHLDILGGFFLIFFLGAISLIFSRTSIFSSGPTLPHHFYFRLPLVYLITFPFLFFNPSTDGVFTFLFNPTHAITAIFFTRINSFAEVVVVFVSNLFFWFLAGLLIDKIISKFRKNNKFKII